MRRLIGIAVVLGLATTGCGDQHASDAAAAGGSDLTMTRADGSTFTVPDLVVSCGNSPGNPDGPLLIKANT